MSESGKRSLISPADQAPSILPITLLPLMFVPYSFQEPREMYEVNVLGTLNILELCRLHVIPRIVFASSYVYGQPSYLPIDEAHPVNPNNPYGRSKVFGEGLCRAYYEDCGVSCIVLRSFNLYGEGQREHFLIPSILRQLETRTSNSATRSRKETTSTSAMPLTHTLKLASMTRLTSTSSISALV